MGRGNGLHRCNAGGCYHVVLKLHLRSFPVYSGILRDFENSIEPAGGLAVCLDVQGE